LAHRLLAERMRPGVAAIDATAGNGHDTVFLAKAVGPDGIVAAFDLQREAIEATRRRCEAEGVADRVRLIEGCHSRLREAGIEACRGVTFNLGYLPGGEKTRITRPETTIAALEAALEMLAPGGLITIVAYTGHPGGADECAAVEEWAARLDQEEYAVAGYRFLNQANDPPRLIAIDRRAG
jgi:predicted methyltransferase